MRRNKIDLGEQLYYGVDTVVNLLVVIVAYYYAVSNNTLSLLLLSGLCESKLGLIAHESCHGAIPHVYGWLYDVFMGSSEQWKEKHNKGHHLHVNTDLDPDIDVIPFMRISSEQPCNWYHRFQHIYQFLLFPLAAVSLRVQGIYFVYSRGKLPSFLLLNIPSIALFIGLPLYTWGVSGLRFWVIHNAVIGMTYCILFSVSHVNTKTAEHTLIKSGDSGTLKAGTKAEPALSERKNGNEKGSSTWRDEDFTKRQLLSTADWSCGSYFWNFLSGGLNHQVLHHMHPRTSSYHYPSMARALLAEREDEYLRFDNLLFALFSNMEHLAFIGGSQKKVESAQWTKAQDRGCKDGC